jgi:hypothetical protein
MVTKDMERNALDKIRGIVRCEDCIKSCECVNGRWCQRFCTSVNNDSYCSFGEKRKEGREV